jgi:hypothetical protein
MSSSTPHPAELRRRPWTHFPGAASSAAWRAVPAGLGRAARDLRPVDLRFKRRLGLYGKLFDSPVGMIGFGIVMFWVFTAIFADQIITHDPLARSRA